MTDDQAHRRVPRPGSTGRVTAPRRRARSPARRPATRRAGPSAGRARCPPPTPRAGASIMLSANCHATISSSRVRQRLGARRTAGVSTRWPAQARQAIHGRRLRLRSLSQPDRILREARRDRAAEGHDRPASSTCDRPVSAATRDRQQDRSGTGHRRPRRPPRRAHRATETGRLAGAPDAARVQAANAAAARSIAVRPGLPQDHGRLGAASSSPRMAAMISLHRARGGLGDRLVDRGQRRLGEAHDGRIVEADQRQLGRARRSRARRRRRARRAPSGRCWR